jgi:hypothetical protein
MSSALTCVVCGRGQLKCDGTCAETRFCLSAKQMSPFKSAGASVQSTTGSQGVHISGSNAGYSMFLRRVKGTGYPCHSPVSPSLSLPCVTVCHHISTGVYKQLYLVAATSQDRQVHTSAVIQYENVCIECHEYFLIIL